MNRSVVHFLCVTRYSGWSSLNNGFWMQRFLGRGDSGTIGLELSALATSPNPPPFIYTSAKRFLQNKGTAPAQNVAVKINLPASGLPL